MPQKFSQHSNCDRFTVIFGKGGKKRREYRTKTFTYKRAEEEGKKHAAWVMHKGVSIALFQSGGITI